MALLIELLLILWPFVIIPAALLAFVRPLARLAFFSLGLVFYFGLEHVADLGGPDSPALILPFAGLCLAVAAAISEAIVRLFHSTRKAALNRRGTRP